MRRGTGTAARPAAYGGVPARDHLRSTLTYRRILRYLGGAVPSSVFDVGYGDGSLLRHFFDEGADVAGCDPGVNQQDVDPWVAKFGDLYAVDVDEVSVDRRFELVTAVHVVEHLGSVPAMVGLARLVAPGGTLIVVTPTADCVAFERAGSRWWMLEDPTHVRFYSEQSLRLALEGRFGRVEIGRSIADSLGADGASFVPGRSSAGALGDLKGRALTAASMPLALGVRTFSRRARPVLDAVARAPRA